MDGDPANRCSVYFILTFSKNITTGSSLFMVPEVLPV